MELIKKPLKILTFSIDWQDYCANLEDIKEIAHEVLRHRLILTFEAEADNINSDDIIDTILEKITPP